MRILIDADHCPVRIREILIKAASKRELELLFISAKQIPLPRADYISALTVTPGADAADNKIIELATSRDLAVTADIPLATRLVAQGVTVIHPKGDLLTRETIGERLAAYQLMEQLRNRGVDVTQYKAPGRYQQQDSIKAFADTLDRELTKRRQQP